MKFSRHFLELNLGVLAISTSGIFGRMITLSPEITIFWRCLFASLILGAYIKLSKFSTKIIGNHDSKIILVGGLLMGIHWVTYFYALTLSNIAIAILTLHTFPAITSILEPLILKSKFQLHHLILAILVILGVWIILPSADMSDNVVLAIVFGLVSALAYALRNILTKKVVPNYNGSVLMFFQLVIMTFMLIPFIFIYNSSPINGDWPYLLMLILITTVIGHTLLVKHLKNYSAVTVGLLSSIIPVYSILWGLVFLKEIPNTQTIIGGSLILVSFVVESIYSNKSNA